MKRSLKLTEFLQSPKVDKTLLPKVGDYVQYEGRRWCILVVDPDRDLIYMEN